MQQEKIIVFSKPNRTEELIKVLEENKENSRVVTDVGASMFSGWGELKGVRIFTETDKQTIIELIFD